MWEMRACFVQAGLGLTKRLYSQQVQPSCQFSWQFQRTEKDQSVPCMKMEDYMCISSTPWIPWTFAHTITKTVDSNSYLLFEEMIVIQMIYKPSVWQLHIPSKITDLHCRSLKKPNTERRVVDTRQEDCNQQVAMEEYLARAKLITTLQSLPQNCFQTRLPLNRRSDLQ